jgi:hypothetical protein
MNWQPIETAPRNGTWVLIWPKYASNPLVAEFSNNRWYGCYEHYKVSCGRWCEGGSVDTWPNLNPTHWQPLPPPPTETP